MLGLGTRNRSWADRPSRNLIPLLLRRTRIELLSIMLEFATPSFATTELFRRTMWYTLARTYRTALAWIFSSMSHLVVYHFAISAKTVSPVDPATDELVAPGRIWGFEFLYFVSCVVELVQRDGYCILQERRGPGRVGPFSAAPLPEPSCFHFLLRE